MKKILEYKRNTVRNDYWFNETLVSTYCAIISPHKVKYLPMTSSWWSSRNLVLKWLLESFIMGKSCSQAYELPNTDIISLILIKFF